MASLPDGEALDMVAETWSEVLRRIPNDQLNEAYLLAVETRESKSATFPINAAEIAAAWQRKTKPIFKTSGEAWAIACDAVRNAPWNYSGVEPKRMMPDIDNRIIAKCVRSITPDAIAVNEKDEARKRFDWMYRAEVEHENERIEIDPSHQLTESRQALIPELSGMVGKVAKRLETNPNDKVTPEEVREMLQKARAQQVSKRVN